LDHSTDRHNGAGTRTNDPTAFRPGPSKKPGEGSKLREFSPIPMPRRSRHICEIGNYERTE
jgi:hypothetical protein